MEGALASLATRPKPCPGLGSGHGTWLTMTVAKECPIPMHYFSAGLGFYFCDMVLCVVFPQVLNSTQFQMNSEIGPLVLCGKQEIGTSLEVWGASMESLLTEGYGYPCHCKSHPKV